jgi:hypothetical protein
MGMEAKQETAPIDRKKVLKAIAECDRYIAKEEPRNADTRPASAVKMLAFYKAHKSKLQGML